MLAVLKYWRALGLNKHEITAFMALEPQSQIEAMDAINLFDGLYIGVALPDSVVPSSGNWLYIPWRVPPGGPIGDAAPKPIMVTAYPPLATIDVTCILLLGALKPMPWAFDNAYADEAYAVLNSDWAEADHLAPDGFDLTTLEADLAATTR
jgi:hypothetical protein